MRRALGAVAVLAALLTGCGEETESGTAGETASDSASPSAVESAEASPSESAEPTPDGPACDEVWVAGQRLPAKYRGCLDGEKWKDAFVYPCSSGQKLVTFGRTFYAAKGEVITESATRLARDPAFKQAMAVCGA